MSGTIQQTGLMRQPDTGSLHQFPFQSHQHHAGANGATTDTAISSDSLHSDIEHCSTRHQGAVGLTLPTSLGRPDWMNPHVFYVLLFMIIFAWPLFVVLSAVLLPFALPLLFVRVGYNILRASNWSILRGLKLCGVVLSHITGILSVLPLMSTVLWYYYIRGSRDGVRRDIPFAACPFGGSGAQSGFRNNSPSSTSSSTSGAFSGMGFSSRPVSTGLSVTGDRCIADTRLDVYTHNRPGTTEIRHSDLPRPVLVFVYGGGWGTGNKAFYSKLAAIIRSTCDCVVVVPDYPVYPKAGMTTMIDCLFHVVRWVHGNIAKYGGDPHRVFMCGHSAGAHLVMMLALRRALAVSNDAPCPLPSSCLTAVPCRQPVPLVGLSKEKRPISATVSSPIDYRQLPPLSGIILFSGVYDLSYHLAFEHNRGVDRLSVMEAATGGFWNGLSPTTILNSIPSCSTPSASSQASDGGDCGDGTSRTGIDRLARVSKTDDRIQFDALTLPPITLAHSAQDSVVDPNHSVGLRDALRRQGALCSNVLLLPSAHSGIVLDPVQQARDGNGLHSTVATIAGALH